MPAKDKKGFTLIELLVVIAIIAILAVVVILTLNPAELLKQARDSNRIQDLNTLKSAIGVYLADVSTNVSLGTTLNCYMSASSTSPANCGFAGTYTANATTGRAINGNGWVPVNFTQISAGSPIGQLPVDPLNTNPNVYRYVPSTTSLTFMLMAPLESAKYTNATNGTAATDGGASSTAYETGSSLTL